MRWAILARGREEQRTEEQRTEEKKERKRQRERQEQVPGHPLATLFNIVERGY